MGWLLRVARVELVWVAETAGYWIRPFDTLADRRRWRWQARQRCGFSLGLHVDDDGLGPGGCC